MKHKLLTLLLAMIASTSMLFAASGTCGENLTWDLTNGVLTISGTGSMQSYTSPSKVPWYSNVSSINTVIIENGVTTIGSYAFSSYPGLTSVTIPNSVTSIEWYAFFNSGSLLSVAIPDDVEWIGNNAFNGCTSIKSVIIPKGVKYIDERAFFNCTSLSSLTINGNIINIGDYVFGGCSSLAKVFWNAQNGDLPVSVFPNNLDSLIIGENVEEVGISSKPPYYIEFRNPLTRVRSYAAPKSTSFFDYNHDGVMEFVDTVKYKTNGSNNYNVRFKNLWGFYDSDDLLDGAYPDLQTINLNNDTLVDFINGSTLYQANSSGEYEKIELDYTKSTRTDHLFALDADLNGTTDFYSNENGTHYLHLRQFDGSYLKVEMNVISETAEVDSAIYAKWDKPETDFYFVVEDHFPALSENMFLANVTSSDDFKTIDVAVDLDKNGLVDLLSSSTGAVLYNMGNNTFMKGKFPGAVTVKDMNNDGVEDFVIYNESTKTVSLQIYENDGTYKTDTLMQNMNISNVWCYDFDNDGDVDILLPFDWTQSSGYAYLVFFRNDGNNMFKKVESAFDDPVKHFQFLDCRDVDNDGKYEIIARDSIDNRGEYYAKGDYFLIRYSNRLKATMDTSPFVSNAGGGDINSPFIYGDFDNDGTNDCYYKKEVKISYNKYYYYVVLSHFANSKINTAPQKMSAPRVAGDAETGKLLVSWDQGSDAESPNIDLVYSLRIGTAPGLGDMWYASAWSDGKQTSLNAANVGSHLSQIVNISGWKAGDYYIAVQAIDPNGLGGQWSDEVVYHHALSSATFNTSMREIATADTLLVQYAGVVDNTVSYIWDFGDSAAVLSSEAATQTYKIVYNTAGNKTVSLQIATADGRTSPIYTIDILVYPMKLEKSINYCNPNYPSYNYPYCLSYFDMDMDGQMDAFGRAYFNTSDQQGFFKGKADGSFIKLAKTYNTDLTINDYSYLHDSCIFADFNMDGLPDVQWSTSKGTTMYNMEDFDIDFSNETFTIPYTEEKYDFNGDGIDDEVKVKNTYALAIILNGENGEKKDTIELDLPSGYTLQPDDFGRERNPHVYDVDNNGMLDFIVIPQNFDFVGRNIYVIYLNEDWSFYCQDLPYQYYDDFYRTYHYESLWGYPFVDLNNDGTPDFKKGYFMKSRITNEAPAVPTNLRVVQEDEGIYLYWDAAKDKETPAARIRYNISVKKQGVAVGTDNAFVVSPMNGLYDEANIVPGHVYPHGTSYFIPIDKFTGGQTYEFQIQSIDLWNAHSPMSAAYTFTVQPQVLISMPANTCINEPVLVAFTGTNNGEITWNFNGGTASQNSDGTYSVSWSTEGIKTVTATLNGNTSSRVIYVQNAQKDLTFALPERVLNNSWIEVMLPENYLNLDNLAVRTSDNCTGYVLPKKDSRIFRVCFRGTSSTDSEAGWVEFYQNNPVCGEVNTFRASTLIVGNGSAPAISLIAVDAATGKNMITWDAPANLPAYVDSIVVYKEEGATNNWVKQAKVPVSDGQWVDKASDPSVKSNKYCIAYTSIYGGESPKSQAHKTPHLQTNYGLNGAINLYWTYYQGDVVNSYQILRGTSTSNLQVLTTVTGEECSYTDNNPVENAYYAIAYSNADFVNEWECGHPAADAPLKVRSAHMRATRSGHSNIMQSSASVPAILAQSLNILSMERAYTLSSACTTLHLYAEITPSGATFKQVKWTIVSGQNIASINSNGLLTVKDDGQNGTLRVRATTIDGSNIYAERDINVNVFKKTLSLFVNDAEMGTVNGAGKYTEGKAVSISATANYGYHFVQWNDGNTDNPRIVTVTDNITYTAIFAKNTYTITATASPADHGSVTGGASALYNEQLTLTAIPGECYQFVNWNDGNTDNPRTITVTEDKWYIAKFAKATYSITTICKDNLGMILGPSQAECQESVKLTPVPVEGYHFVQWSDGNTDNPRTITITQDTTIIAEFGKNIYTITVNIPYYQVDWGAVTGAGEYEYGSTVVISAEPNYGYHFAGWAYDTNTDNPRTIVVTKDANYIAEFAKNIYSISVTCEPEQGSVSYPEQAEYLKQITIRATPNTGYRFVQWNDGDTKNPRSVVITQDTAFTALFEPEIYTITFQNDDGTIIDQVELAYGTMPTHENPSKPDNGIYSYTFIGWEPALTIVTQDATYTAQYKVTEISTECQDIHTTWLQTGGSGLGEMEPDGEMWQYDDKRGAVITGKGAESLCTPPVFLADVSSVTLSFSHMYSTVPTYNLSLWVCPDFKNTEDDVWQELTIPKYSTANYIDVSIKVPTNYVGKNTVFGFYYSSSQTSGNWKIKNLKLDAQCAGSTPPQPTYYTIRFLNWDGSVLQNTQVEEGKMPTYTGATPVRAEDETYTYSFSGWSPTIVAATADTDYTAQFTATKKTVTPTYYTIRFLNWDGSVLQNTQVEEGKMPTYTGVTPVKPEDETYTYSFSGWSPTIVVATANADYRAQFTATKKPIGECTDMHLTWLEIGTNDFGEITTDNAEIWTWDSRYGAIGNKSGGAIGWLLTPVNDLSGMEKITLSFSHVHRYAVSYETEMTLWVCADYQGSVETSSWQQLTIAPYASNTSWTYVDVVVEVPESKVGERTVFGFKYMSTETNYAKWEIKDLHLDAQCADSPEAIENTSDQTQDKVRKILHDGQIYILRGDKTYTLTGQEVK